VDVILGVYISTAGTILYLLNFLNLVPPSRAPPRAPTQTGAREVSMAAKKSIKHDYRSAAKVPAKFFTFTQKVRRSLTGNPNYPESVWGPYWAILQRFFQEQDQLETVYQQASNGDRIYIRERDKLIEEMIVTLDEMASFLEAVSTRNPDALYTTGFSVCQERRSTSRAKLPLLPPTDFAVGNLGEPEKASASASAVLGAFNYEIQINKKDPSVEADWFHKDIFNDPSNMIMENISQGNTFFRARPHGPDGAGPWSSIVSTTIT
jgi:hypothetical protein